MTILPIRDIREEDAPTIGGDLYSLGMLYRAGFPVPEGIIITAPEIHLKSVLEHFHLGNKEIFEQKLTLIKEEIAKIPPPFELEVEFKKRRLDQKKLWLHLLDFWLQQIRSRLWREGFSPDLTRNLTAQPIFFMEKQESFGKVFFDYERNKLVLDVEMGSLNEVKMVQLEKLVKDANKKLLLPQIYDWSYEKKIHIIKVTPFTHYPAEVGETFNSNAEPEKKIQKSSVKVFLTSLGDLSERADLDGAIFYSENASDFDQKVIKLMELGEILPTVILRLFDKREQFGRIRGAQYLIHNKEKLREDVEALHFLRNKKYLNNISLAIPCIRSTAELKQIKQDLLSLKISRGASMKYWLEIAVPENLINIESYLEIGVDGILLNCNDVCSWLGGFDPDDPDSIYYHSEIQAFLKLLEDVLPKFHKAKLPVIAIGSLAMQDEILYQLLKKGVWGIGVDSANVTNIHDRIRLIERRLLHTKS